MPTGKKPINSVLIVPCYNEGKRLNAAFFETLFKLKSTFWIFVNDGSNDNTLEILESWRHLNVKVLNLKVNNGKANAIRQGFNYATNNLRNLNWIGFLDADGAFTYDDIKRILRSCNHSKFSKIDAIYAARVKLSGRQIMRNKKRHYIARVIASFFGLFWENIPYDTQTGFKIYRYSSQISKIMSTPFHTKWFVDIEITLRFFSSFRKQLAVWEEPINSWQDVRNSKIKMFTYFIILKEFLWIMSLLFNSKIKNTKI